MKRSMFAALSVVGVLMPLSVFLIAYLFRNFPGLTRAAAMISALFGIIM